MESFEKFQSTTSAALDQSFREQISFETLTFNTRSKNAPELPEMMFASADTYQTPDSQVAERSKLVAEAGSTVYAESGTEVVAKPGSTVYAEKGSVVQAEKGSTVYARKGSQVNALDGNTVNAPDGPTIHQEKGARVAVPASASVSAYKDAVVETQNGGKVNAFDGSTVYATCTPDYGFATTQNPPTVFAKGKCSIFSMKGTTVDVQRGAEAKIRGWDGKFPIDP